MLETGRQTASQGVGALSSLTFQGTGGGDNLIPDEHWTPPLRPLLCVLV